jgi:hypothetical protein
MKLLIPSLIVIILAVVALYSSQNEDDTAAKQDGLHTSRWELNAYVPTKEEWAAVKRELNLDKR